MERRGHPAETVRRGRRGRRSGLFVPVPPVAHDAVHRRWTGERTVAFVCPSSTVFVWSVVSTSAWPILPQRARWTSRYRCADCFTFPAGIRIFILLHLALSWIGVPFSTGDPLLSCRLLVSGCARVYAGLPPIIFSCVALCASTWDIRKAGQTDCDCAGLSLITSVQGILHERMRTRKFVEERSEGTGTR
jgi:hypothetical protein